MSFASLRERLARLNQPRGIAFGPKTDRLLRSVALLAILGAPTPVLLVAYGASPLTTDVGYAPEQPVPYSHRLHVGELGIDCRYCHTSVDRSDKANIPPTKTCMNCHAKIRTESELLQPVFASYETGLPIDWVRVHDLPDFAYFDHSAHVTRGVGCVTCHGRIDTMDVVYQAEPLSMAWCLDCHRHPEANLRPPEEATNMAWTPPGGQSPEEFGRAYRKLNDINPPTDCSTCHR